MAEPSNQTPFCPRCAELERHIAQLEAHVAQLERQLEQATRTAKRQAAPFSKHEPKKDPKSPGRKSEPGYGTPAFRAAPPPGKIDEAVLPVRCPTCGGMAHETHLGCQCQLEIP